LLSAAVLAVALAAAPQAETVRTWPAPEASQGVAVDARHFYAVGNSTIAKYDRATGRKVAQWSGDPKLYPHINSCAVIGRELICAASNFPAVPMLSFVEVFDPQAMVHRRTIPLGEQRGSLTWIDRKGGAWWAGFANYDGRGGEPGRDHRATKVVRFDSAWRPLQTWSFPDAVLDRFKPMSNSGGGFGPDGLLYASGHDAPEVYALRAPASGSTLELVETLGTPVEGQAIAFDKSDGRVLFGVSRKRREVTAMRLPMVGGR
jgi:hypothetical protein